MDTKEKKVGTEDSIALLPKLPKIVVISKSSENAKYIGYAYVSGEVFFNPQYNKKTAAL